MMTKKQIEAARSVSVCWPAAREALDAYSRVLAWVEGDALAAVINSRHLPPEVREAMRGCRDDVRRALEG